MFSGESKMRKSRYFLIYFFMLAVNLPVNAEQDEQVIFRQVQDLIDNYQGDQFVLDKSAKLLQQILRSNPRSAFAYIGLGRVAYKQGYINYTNYEGESLTNAHDFFKKAISLNPKLFDAYFYGFYPYLYEKEYQKAKEFAQKAQEIDPGSPRVDLLFAEIAKSEENLKEVEQRSLNVINKSTHKKLLLDAYSLLTWVYKVKEQYDLADTYYIKSIDLAPTSAWGKINYSSFLISQGRYDEAISYGHKALEIMDFGMGHHILGKAYYNKGSQLLWKEKQADKSKEYFEQAIYHDSENYNSYYGLGVSLYITGNNSKNPSELKGAKSALTKAIQLNPNFQEAKDMLNRLAQF